MQTITGLGITRSKPNGYSNSGLFFFCSLLLQWNGKERTWFSNGSAFSSFFLAVSFLDVSVFLFFLNFIWVSSRTHSRFYVHYFQGLQMFGVIFLLLLARIGTFSFFCLNIKKKTERFNCLIKIFVLFSSFSSFFALLSMWFKRWWMKGEQHSKRFDKGSEWKPKIWEWKRNGKMECFSHCIETNKIKTKYKERNNIY